MITTVTNYGDSLGVQIPKSLLETVHISENDKVEILIANSAVMIKRPERKNHLTTKERIAAFCDTSMENIKYCHLPEIDWGKSQGNEIW